MSDTLQLGQHPDADQLSAFAEQALPAHEREQTLGHLAECAHCRQIVALSLPPLEESPIAVSDPVFRPGFGGWFSGWRLAWLAVPALAALLVFTIHLRVAPANHRQAAEGVPVAVLHPPVPQAAPPPESEPPAAKTASSSSAARAAKPQGPVLPSGHLVEGPPAPGNYRALLKVPPPRAQSIGGPVAINGAMAGIASGNGAGLGTGASASIQKLPYAAPSENRFAQGLPPTLPSPMPVAAQPATAADYALTALPTGDEAVTAAASASPAPPAAAYALRTNSFVSTLAPLPSGLPIVSIAANLHRRAALDTQHALFYSDDDGQHWKPVSPPWAGRAIAVAMFATAIPHPAIISAGSPSLSSGRAKASSAPAARSFAWSSLQQSAPINTSGSSLSGTVTDSTGAIIPGALVVLRPSRPSIARTAGTDAFGRYLFAKLDPGSYRIEAAAPGFEKLSLPEEITASQNAIANLTLAVGQASQTVSVEVASSQIEIQPQTTVVPASAAKSFTAPAIAKQMPPIFVIITDTGDRWTSADGQSWQREIVKGQ